MAAQLVFALCGCALVPVGLAASALEPWSPCCGGDSAATMIRSAALGVQVSVMGSQTPLAHEAWPATVQAALAVTIAPTPPEMPRTLPSKSAISSLTAVQLRMR